MSQLHPARQDAAHPQEHWVFRVHRVSAVISTMVALNVLWIVFTLAGAVVLGVAPATVAAAHCVREQVAGRHAPTFSTFVRMWRSQFVGANLALLPLQLVVGILAVNYVWFSALGPQESAGRLGTLAALLVVAGVAAWAPAMYVHYEVRGPRLITSAVRFALARPIPTVAHLFALSALAYASYRLPALVISCSIGAWLYASTYLSLRLFDENEALLSAR